MRTAWWLEREVRRKFNVPYRGRAEVGPRNLQVKMARLSSGGTFEQPSIQLVNLAAVGLVPIGSRVFEIGSGTGYFAINAARLRGAKVLCSESDTATREWAEENRPDPNVTYCNLSMKAVGKNGFDVVVALEVVEHIKSYATFLRGMAKVAPIAILSTPNKLRDAFSAVQAVPEYDEHVLEWTAGEFYWVLKCFWSDVQIWTIPEFRDQTQRFEAGKIAIPVVAPTGIWEFEEPLIAVCRSPIAMD